MENETQTKAHFTAHASGDQDHITYSDSATLHKGGSVQAMCGYTIPGVDFFSLIHAKSELLDDPPIKGNLCSHCFRAYRKRRAFQ